MRLLVIDKVLQQYGIRVGLVIPCGLRDITHKVGPNEDVRDLSGGDYDALI